MQADVANHVPNAVANQLGPAVAAQLGPLLGPMVTAQVGPAVTAQLAAAFPPALANAVQHGIALGIQQAAAAVAAAVGPAVAAVAPLAIQLACLRAAVSNGRLRELNRSIPLNAPYYRLAREEPATPGSAVPGQVPDVALYPVSSLAASNLTQVQLAALGAFYGIPFPGSREFLLYILGRNE